MESENEYEQYLSLDRSGNFDQRNHAIFDHIGRICDLVIHEFTVVLNEAKIIYRAPYTVRILFPIDNDYSEVYVMASDSLVTPKIKLNWSDGRISHENILIDKYLKNGVHNILTPDEMKEFDKLINIKLL